MFKLLIAVFVAVTFFPAIGCAIGNARIDSQTTAVKPRQEGSGQAVQVKGTLTGEGVECQALRGDDGTLYTISRLPEGFKVGDRVLVTGEVAQISFCMQGTTINVTRIEQIKD